MTRFSLTVITLLLMASQLFGNTQEKVVYGLNAQQIAPGAKTVRLVKYSPVPDYVEFYFDKTIPVSMAEQYIETYFDMGDGFGLELIGEEKDGMGMIHYRYQQTFNDIPVETGMYILHTKAGRVLSMNGRLYPASSFPASISLTEEAALDAALSYIGASVYKWEIEEEEEHWQHFCGHHDATYYPEGELTYMAPAEQFYKENFQLTYKFNVYAHEPMSRRLIYIDTDDGNIVFEHDQIHHGDVTGTAVTGYSGTQTIVTDSVSATEYRLREAVRGIGNGVETYDLNEGTTFGSAVDFTDTDNYWNNVNPQKDEFATDAHWGAEMTYDYFYYDHGRNSIDDAGFKLISYVHYSSSYVNAFWNGSWMTYGDGSGAYGVLTSLDIAGHEITHGLTSRTAALIYMNESGALNESFSDIFGEMVEHYATGTNDWLMSQTIGVAFRSMSAPKTKGDPDTYYGTNWYTGSADNGGVHTNSGVQNFWFYLMCEGGSGTNDNSDAYSIGGVGIDTASAIAFRNLTVYLTPSSDHADARFYAIQSAIDLYGACSYAHEQTADAWYAVGVGSPYSVYINADFTPSTTYTCDKGTTFSFSNGSINATSYYWDFGDGKTDTVANPSHVYDSAGMFTVTLIADGGLCGTDTITYTNLIEIDPPSNPTTLGDSICGPGMVNLEATGTGTLTWYDVATGGTGLATGTTYNPTVSATSTYYVASTSPGDIVKGDRRTILLVPELTFQELNLLSLTCMNTVH